MIYIYKLIDPRDNEVRYVGKTNNPKRRYKQHLYDKRTSHKASWVKSLRSFKLKPIFEILEVCESNWIEREKYWISQFDNLTNLKEGGGSDYIRTTSDETKEKLRLLYTGRKLTDEWKHKQCLSSNRLEVIIDGITYPSIKNASITLGISQYAIKKIQVSQQNCNLI